MVRKTPRGVRNPKSPVRETSGSSHLVWEAYRRVKANKGAPGVDGCSIEQGVGKVGIQGG